MNGIVFAVVLVSVVGLIGAVVLVLAAKFMAVYEDPRVAQCSECLPGANCGGCGYAGCSDYARAVVEGAPVNKCAVGGPACAAKLAEIMGVEAGDSVAKAAVVACTGAKNGICEVKFDYQGIKSCAAAAALAGGPSACAFGCVGLGDCVAACNFDAIHVVDGVATVDRSKCVGCGACVQACPKKIIMLGDAPQKPVVQCSNHEMGKFVMKECKNGCISCGLCVKNCPEQAITLDNFLAKIDYAKCTGCGTCIEKCPKKVIHWQKDA